MKTKLGTTKKLIIFASCLLVAVMLIPTVFFPSVFAYTEEDKKDVPSVTLNIDAKEESEIGEKKVDDKSTDIQEKIMVLEAEKNIALIEENLASNNTDVPTELSKRIGQYEDMLAVEESEAERIKIQNLIDATRQLTSKYQLHESYYADSKSANSYAFGANDLIGPIIINPTLPALAYVTAVIAAFSELDYDLAVELTTL